jgi:nitrogen-specific signal transduction histidine kinase/GAF domain-containing protein
MELLALLSNSDDFIIPAVKSTLKKYTVYPLKTIEELEELYSNIPLNLLIIDTLTHRMSTLDEFLNKHDDDIVLLITSEKIDKCTKETLPKSVFDCIDTDTLKSDLPAIVERALERQRFKNELRLIKESRDLISPMQMQSYAKSEPETITRDFLSPRYDPVSGGRYIQEKVIINFAKLLTCSFDMRKLFDHFIESVMEIARVSRMSVLIKDKEEFRVKTHYGLDPYIADNLRLGSDSALVSWLSKTGRIMNKPVTFADSITVNIKKEMELLQCVVSFPMVYKGKLIGILNIDNKITEEQFYREELEIIYILCNYLAAAIKDIDHYHQMWYQKEFTNNLLSSMNSGMIAIGKDEKVTIFNQQASEILNLDTDAMVGSDLRALPSPLGDILFETMEKGTSYKRYEVTVHPREIPLGINSYRLTDEQHDPIGAGIIFSDLSDSIKLEKQHRRADQLEAVNDMMAKIAHEVRNPLTSIQTYTQLLNERYSDDELKSFFITTVGDSINRLTVLIDKLVSFSSTQSYNLKKEDVNTILTEAANFIEKHLPDTHKITSGSMNKVISINADKKQLIKAMYYLVLSIIDRTPDGTTIEINTGEVREDEPFIKIELSYSGGQSLEDRKEVLLKPLLDINHLGTELNVPISHKIIDGHRGSLDLLSHPDMSAFIISLPIVERKSKNVSVKEGQAGE